MGFSSRGADGTISVPTGVLGSSDRERAGLVPWLGWLLRGVSCSTRRCSGPLPAVALGGMLEVMNGGEAAAERPYRWTDPMNGFNLD